MSVFTGIGNNISICYKFQNDFNDYFQDKNNKNINDYKSIFVSVFVNIEDEDKNIKDFHSFCKDKRISFKDKRISFKDNFSNIIVSLFVGIGNNMNVYIVEVPNETAPSIQGFAKPPA